MTSVSTFVITAARVWSFVTEEVGLELGVRREKKNLKLVSPVTEAVAVHSSNLDIEE